MHLYGSHFLGYVLACALYQPLAQVGGELRPGIGGDVDAASQRAAHVGGDLPDGVHLHRVRDEDAGLSVRVIDRKLHGDNRAVVFQRGNLDVEPLRNNLSYLPTIITSVKIKAQNTAYHYIIIKTIFQSVSWNIVNFLQWAECFCYRIYPQ